VRYARELGLDRIGGGCGNYLSYGYLDLLEGSAVAGPTAAGTLVPGGFARGVEVADFDQTFIAEHVAHSWFEDYDGGLHPSVGQTRPYATGHERDKYSWAKAPRYDGQPAETGPLAEAVVSGRPLFVDYIGRRGGDALVRQLARIARPAFLIPAIWPRKTPCCSRRWRLLAGRPGSRPSWWSDSWARWRRSSASSRTRSRSRPS
jgi:hydrogenase large subunit